MFSVLRYSGLERKVKDQGYRVLAAQHACQNAATLALRRCNIIPKLETLGGDIDSLAPMRTDERD